MWKKLFIENAYDEYNDDEEISSLLWNPIAIRHAIRAFVFALNNTNENGLNLNKELLSYYIKSCWGPNRILREAFAATVPIVLEKDGLILEVVHQKGDKWENIKEFCSYFKISDSTNAP